MKIFSVYGLDSDKFINVCYVLSSFLKPFNSEVSGVMKSVFINFFNTFLKEYYLKITGTTQIFVKNAFYPILQR